MDLWVRLGVGALLAISLFGVGVHYEAVEDDHDPYPDEEQLREAYEEYVGERALLFGTVESIGDSRFVMTVQSDAGSFEMAVPENDIAVDPGGVVQVYGILDPDRTVDPVRIVVVTESGDAGLYKYGVSAVGALVVALLFVRHWRLGTDAWTLEVREDG